MARRIEVEIVGDSSSLERAFKRSERSARDFNRSMERAGRGGLAASLSFRNLGRSMASASLPFLGGAGFVAGVKSAESAASDLNEQIGKTDVVFGKSAAAVEDWSKTTTEAYGLSRRAALTYASTFGALFRPLGLATSEAARQSQRLTQLGADLASFYNTDVADALDAIRSGIVGESEPLRQYGVLLSEARVQQEAMNETGKTTASQLTAQDKVLARIALIFRDSANAQGDFSRSSHRLAGQTKTLQANVDNLQASLGKLAIPVLTDVVSGLNDAAGAVDELSAAFKRLGGVKIKFPGMPDAIAPTLGSLARSAARNAPFVGTALDLVQLLNKGNAKAKPPPGLAGTVGGQLSSLVPPGLTGLVKPHPAIKQLSVALQAAEVDARLSGSRSRLRAVLEREAGSLRDAIVNSFGLKPKDKLALKQALLGVTGEIKSIDDEIAGEITDRAEKRKAAAEKARLAAKEAAQKLRQAADEIKSAILEQFDRRQTNVQNQRELRDSLSNLAFYRQLGGPGGIRLAQQRVTDARAAILRARLEAAPARLTKAGQFALGNVVTINVHGSSDPDKVAAQVVAILQRRSRHTSQQSRGPTAGTYLGPH